MPTIGNMPNGQKSSLDGTEKIPLTGDFYALISQIATYISSLTQTITGKTINLTNNTLTGTTVQFNTALSDNDFTTLAGIEVLTNKTLTTPTIGDFTNANHTHLTTIQGGGIGVGPQGWARNYKLSITVASNNITVALKGADGNDPSATNPVRIRIGDTERTVTAALSVTKNAGTNWFNSGGTELATQVVGYFVYLGYNATDGVVLGFARIPYARSYGDFSATTTNEKYCAISTITNAASTDYYENIGYFEATLSATASFNWSVAAFTASNLINRPTFETRWLTWLPAYTGFTGAVTTVLAHYKITGNSELRFQLRFTGTGTGSPTVLVATAPFNGIASNYPAGSCLWADAATGFGGFYLTSGTPYAINAIKYNLSAFGNVTDTISGEGFYEI